MGWPRRADRVRGTRHGRCLGHALNPVLLDQRQYRPLHHEGAAGFTQQHRARDIDEEDVLGFDHGDKIYCIYNTADGYFATDGMCTHEDERLDDGIVIDCVIECPLHQGRFDVRTGSALSAPVCIGLKTWPLKVDDGQIYIDLGAEA